MAVFLEGLRRDGLACFDLVSRGGVPIDEPVVFPGPLPPQERLVCVLDGPGAPAAQVILTADEFRACKYGSQGRNWLVGWFAVPVDVVRSLVAEGYRDAI